MIDDNARGAGAPCEAVSRRFQELYQNIPAGCLCYDRQGRILGWNSSFDTLCGPFTGDQSQVLQQVLEVIEGERLTPEQVEWIFSGNTTGWDECETARCDGSPRHLLVSDFPLYDAAGAVIAGVNMSIDITPQKLEEAELRHEIEAIRSQIEDLSLAKNALETMNQKLEVLASRDGLTGLKNRLAFQDRLSVELVRAERYHMPLSLILIDIDHFKPYNDYNGHPAGDRVLVQLGKILVHTARSVDFVARFGGEEFAVILPHTGVTGSVKFAERFRKGIEAAKWPFRAVTASLGVSTFASGEANIDSLIEAADRALYLSKSNGRNRVTHYNDGAKNGHIS